MFRPDLGGNPLQGVTSPLRFDIRHRSERKSMVTGKKKTFEIHSMDAIVPGFSRYSYCETPDSHVLGILANIELLDVLAHSFNGASGPA
jgi:hypothetical protein